LKKLLKITGFTATLTITRMLVGFIVAKVVAIYAGPTGLALMGQVQGFVASLNGVLASPVGAGVIKYTAENYPAGNNACSPWWKASIYWCFCLWLFLAPIIIFFSEAIAYWILSSKNYQWLIILIVFISPISVFGTLFNSVVNGQQKYKLLIKNGMIAVLVSGIAIVVLVTYFGIKGAIIAATIQSSIIGFVLLSLSLKQPWFKLKFWWGTSSKQQKNDIRSYIFMAVTTALTVPVALILVRKILAGSVGWEQAGLWQAVWKISEVYLTVITLALTTYFLPKLSVLKKNNELKLEILNTAKVIMPIIILIAILIYFLRDVAISLLFTEDFYSARYLFAIQLTGDVVKIASSLIALPMIARKLTNWYVFSEMFFSITFVLLAFWFVNVYGIDGANIAYLLNYTLYFLFILFNFNRMTNQT